MKVWTTAEVTEFRRAYAGSTDAELAERFGVTIVEVATLAERYALAHDKRLHGGTRMRRWTQVELRRVRELHADHSDLEIARILGRTTVAVTSCARRLGLRKSEARLAVAGSSSVRWRRWRTPREAEESDS